jgi:hypothetical protein
MIFYREVRRFKNRSLGPGVVAPVTARVMALRSTADVAYLAKRALMELRESRRGHSSRISNRPKSRTQIARKNRLSRTAGRAAFLCKAEAETAKKKEQLLKHGIARLFDDAEAE